MRSNSLVYITIGLLSVFLFNFPAIAQNQLLAPENAEAPRPKPLSHSVYSCNVAIDWVPLSQERVRVAQDPEVPPIAFEAAGKKWMLQFIQTQFVGQIALQLTSEDTLTTLRAYSTEGSETIGSSFSQGDRSFDIACDLVL